MPDDIIGQQPSPETQASAQAQPAPEGQQAPAQEAPPAGADQSPAVRPDQVQIRIGEDVFDGGFNAIDGPAALRGGPTPAPDAPAADAPAPDAPAQQPAPAPAQQAPAADAPAQQAPAPDAPGIAQREAQLADQQFRFAYNQQHTQLTQEAQTYIGTEVSKGVTQDQATAVASEWLKGQRQILDVQAQNFLKEQNLRQSLQTAAQLSGQYNVPVEQLLRYETPQAMEMAAKDQSSLRSELDAIRAEQTEIKRNQARQNAPAQNFDQPGPGPASTSDAGDMWARGQIDQIPESLRRELIEDGIL